MMDGFYVCSQTVMRPAFQPQANVQLISEIAYKDTGSFSSFERENNERKASLSLSLSLIP
jgi:hypothetical protein